MKTPCSFFFILIACLFSYSPLSAFVDTETIRTSLVRINTTVQQPNYLEPWKPGKVGQGVGTGFVIDGNRVMTNAHVVSDARLILLEREGDPQQYPARIQHIAHDCDLAVLVPDDPHFFTGVTPLTFGGIPKLHSTVSAIGYPIGGQRISITRGVVSRIEFQSYAHSGMDSHLAVQIDAAINPGNSGGPVIQDDKVVGVAFQGFAKASAQNVGYMIPMPVINRFLTDIEDGEYNGYMELAVQTMNLLNKDYRRFLNLPDDNRGVIVTQVLSIGPAHGVLKENDILLSIDGYSISSNATILLEGEHVHLEEIVERKFHGDLITMELLRNGERISVDIELHNVPELLFFSRQYDKKPRFITFAGLVFQPLSRNFLYAHGLKDPDIIYYYESYMVDETYLKQPEFVILSTILPDSINSGLDEMKDKIVDRVNGKEITSLSALYEALSQKADNYYIELRDAQRPIVIEAGKLAEARERINSRYQIERTSQLVN